MTADEYFAKLEYRICREIEGLRGEKFRGLWCDGFIPENLENAEIAAVTGRVWMGRGGRHQEAWQFVLVLPRALSSFVGVDWAPWLPAEDVTGWLTLDQDVRQMRIDPSNAHSDNTVVD